MKASTKTLAIVAAVLSTVAMLPPGAHAQDMSVRRPTLGQRIDDAISARAGSLGEAPSAAHALVRSRIAFEPYVGILKGAAATYLTGAGNGADQALLLDRLIAATGTGVETRFAACDLPRSQADDLETEAPPLPAGAVMDEAQALAAAIDDPALSPAILELAERRDAIRAEASQDAGVLEEALQRHGYPWQTDATEPGGSTVEHVWLQAYIDGEWTDLDTTDASGVPPCDAEATFATLPATMEHRMSISVVADVRTDGRLREDELLRLEMPLRDVAASRISLVFGEPSGLIEASTEAGFGLDPDPDAGLSPYTPVLLVDGETFAGDPIAFPSVGSFVADEVDEALGGALDLFGELPGGEEPSASASASDGVTGVWLDIDLVAPDGESMALRSEIVDRLGPAARADGTEATSELLPLEEVDGEYASLGTLWQIALLTGPNRAIPRWPGTGLDPFTIDGLSAHLDAMLRTFPALRSDFGAETIGAAVILAGVRPAVAGSSVAEVLLLDALHVPAPRPSGASSAASDALASLAAEELLVATSGGRADGSESASAILRTARRSETPFLLLSPGDAVGPGEASPEALARMSGSLDRGNRLLVPAEPPIMSGSPTLAWYEIDPETGLVRDAHENGRHSQAETAAGEVRAVSFMNRLRQYGCRLIRPAAFAALLIYGGTGAAASPVHEVLEEVVQAAEAEAERRAEREVAERAACSGT